jgi:broad specificity phosphatase PhoE
MKTILYLVSHGSSQPISNRGGRQNSALSPLATRQAELTRDLMGIRPIDACYCGPAEPSIETAMILVEPHDLAPVRLAALADLSDGESLRGFQKRVTGAFERVLQENESDTLLVAAPLRVNRIYLAGLLGLRSSRAHEITLDDCGISIVVRDEAGTGLSTLNAAFHLQGVAA